MKQSGKRVNKFDIWSVIEQDKDVLGGRLVFRNTRVPVKIILEYLANGWSVGDIKEFYPTVKSQDISKLLKEFHREIKRQYV